MLRTELLTLLRTSEAYTFGLLPATLLVPVTVVFAVLVASLHRDPVLVLPEGDRPDLATDALVDALADDWQVRWAADAAAEVAAGRADAAVVSWREDPALSLGVELAVGDDDTRADLERDLRHAVQAEIDRRVVAAGGAPGVDREVGSVSRARVGSAVDKVTGRFATFAFAAFMAGYLGCFLVPARTTAERLSGALESMTVTAMPLGLWFTARVVVAAAFTELVVLLPMGSMALLLGAGGRELPGVVALDLLELYAALLVFDAAFVVCGLAANSVRMSLYFASYAVLVTLPVAALPFWHDVPFVPIAGLASTDAGTGVQLARIGVAAVVAALLVALAGRLARLDRQLPVAGAGE